MQRSQRHASLQAKKRGFYPNLPPYVRDVYDSEDDEEPPSVKKELEVAVKREVKAPAKRVKVKERETLDNRIILLTFKNRTGKQVKWPLSKDILDRIPKYASKVHRAKTSFSQEARLSITDDTRRDEDRMLDVVDYLARDYIKPVGQTSEQAHLQSLTRLVSLAERAVSLDMRGLLHKISVLIACEVDLTAATFVAVARLCCASDSELDVSKGTTIGNWIRDSLVMHLDELDADDYFETIAEQGGKLSVLLTRFFVETYV